MPASVRMAMKSFIVVVVLAKAMVEVRVSVISKRLLVRFCAGVCC
jgi:hypothetical protein